MAISQKRTAAARRPRWTYPPRCVASGAVTEAVVATPVRVAATDKIRITCTYDNSQAHQPYVNGAQQTSRNVTWGESSLDEMCMTYVTYLP